MKRTEIEARARAPYARVIQRMEQEIALLRALARALGASPEALDATSLEPLRRGTDEWFEARHAADDGRP